MMQNQHFSKRTGCAINSCLCHDCFARKCFVYESIIEDIQSQYLIFKAYVEHQRGNVEASYVLQEQDFERSQEAFSSYALPEIEKPFHAVPDHPEFDVIDELRKYLLRNDFKFKGLSSFEMQHMMRKRK